MPQDRRAGSTTSPRSTVSTTTGATRSAFFKSRLATRRCEPASCARRFWRGPTGSGAWRAFPGGRLTRKRWPKDRLPVAKTCSVSAGRANSFRQSGARQPDRVEVDDEEGGHTERRGEVAPTGYCASPPMVWRARLVLFAAALVACLAAPQTGALA